MLLHTNLNIGCYKEIFIIYILIIFIRYRLLFTINCNVSHNNNDVSRCTYYMPS